jgi:hypothetical protein
MLITRGTRTLWTRVENNGGEEHSTGASANTKLSATSAADAASAYATDIENANTSNANTTNKTNNTNNGMAGAVTRAANHLKRCKSTPDGAIACGQKPHKKRRRVSSSRPTLWNLNRQCLRPR